MRRIIAVAALLFCSARCSTSQPHSPENHGAFDAAPNVTRAAATNDPHIVALHAMTGDVEILSGDPDKPGEPFVIRINELPGTRIPLHSHPVDENITVLQGTWYFAVGKVWDEKALTPLRAGDYAFAPKGSTMFAYCPDGAIVQVHGIGPFQIHWGHGLKTLNDADAASTFTLRKGDNVSTSRGPGVIREGYASGDIVQYEIEGANGRFMADQSDVRRSAALDHIMLGVRDLDKGIAEFQAATGVTPVYGGKHPGRGTQNALVSLGNGSYLELIAPSDEPSSEELAALLRKLEKPAALHWAVRVSDAEAVRAKLQQAGFGVTAARAGSRVTPSGNTLRWVTFDFEKFSNEGAPFFIEWSRDTAHPSTTSPAGCTLRSFNVASPAAKELTQALGIAGLATPIDQGDRAKITFSLDCGGRVVRFGD